MHLQKLVAFSTLALLGNIAGTLADIEADEVPRQCQQVCDSIVQRSDHCDRSTHDDRAEKECMCKLKDASTVIPQCEACVAKYHSEVSDDNDPHDNDVYDIIKFCDFSTTTYTGMPATTTGSMTSATGSSATDSTTTGASATDSSATGSSATDSTTTGASATDSSATGSSATGSSSTGSSASESASPTNGANVMNVGGGILGVTFACAAALL